MAFRMNICPTLKIPNAAAYPHRYVLDGATTDFSGGNRHHDLSQLAHEAYDSIGRSRLTLQRKNSAKPTEYGGVMDAIKLDHLFDKADILEVVERYCRGIDRLDTDLVTT